MLFLQTIERQHSSFLRTLNVQILPILLSRTCFYKTYVLFLHSIIAGYFIWTFAKQRANWQRKITDYTFAFDPIYWIFHLKMVFFDIESSSINDFCIFSRTTFLKNLWQTLIPSNTFLRWQTYHFFRDINCTIA